MITRSEPFRSVADSSVPFGNVAKRYFGNLKNQIDFSNIDLLSRNGSSKHHSENQKEGKGNANSYGVSLYSNSFSIVLDFTTLLNS